MTSKESKVDVAHEEATRTVQEQWQELARLVWSVKNRYIHLTIIRRALLDFANEMETMLQDDEEAELFATIGLFEHHHDRLKESITQLSERLATLRQ